jgi:hypothetical protein
LCSAPLTAYFFGALVPIALVGNMVVIPLAFLIVLTGSLSLILGSCVPPASYVLNHVNLALISALVGAVDLIGSVPFGRLALGRVSLGPVTAWYAVLSALAFRLHRNVVDRAVTP